MSILMLSPAYPPVQCGIGDYLHLLCRHLHAAGEEIEVLTSEEGRKEPGVHTTLPVNWTLANIGHVLKEIERLQPEIVHMQYPLAGYRHGVVAALPVAIKQRFPEIKLCLTLHELQRQRWRSRLEAFAAACVADAVLFSRQTERLYFRARAGRLRDWGSAVPLVTVPIPSTIPVQPSADREWVRTRLGIGTEDICLVFFGFVRPDKQVEVLLEAWEQLSPHYPRLHLALYADFAAAHRDNADTLEYRRSLRPVLERLQARSTRLHVEGYLEDPKAVSAALLASDIGVLPFRDGVYEASTVLMAMLEHGLPVVTTGNHLAPRKLLEAVHLAPTNDATGLTTAIVRLVEEAQPSSRSEQAARLWVEQHSWHKVVQQHLELYHMLGKPGLLPADRASTPDVGQARTVPALPFIEHGPLNLQEH